MEHNESTEFFRETDPKSIQEFQLDTLKYKAEANYNNIKGLFYLIPIPACITNEDREFEEVNDAYCRLYGYEREALVGESFVVVVPDEAKEELAGRHDDFFHHKYEFSGEWDVVHQNVKKKKTAPRSPSRYPCTLVRADHRAVRVAPAGYQPES